MPRKFRGLFAIGLLAVAGWIFPAVAYYEALASLAAARTLRHNGFPAQAIPFYDIAIWFAPDKWMIHQARGLAYFSTGRYSYAVKDFNQAHELNPTDTYTLVWRGSALNYLGQFDEAVNDFTEASRLSPKDSDAYRLRAWANFSLKKYEQAAADYTKVIELDPSKPVSYYDRACALAKAEKSADALRDLDTAIAMAPSQPQTGRMLRLRASVRSEIGDNEGALADLDSGEVLACSKAKSNRFCARPFVRLRQQIRTSLHVPKGSESSP